MSASDMDITQDTVVHRSTPGRIPLVSACPACQRDQAQWYSPGALRRLLDGGHPIEAYCVMCDRYWQINANERASLAAKPQLYRFSNRGATGSRWLSVGDKARNSDARVPNN